MDEAKKQIEFSEDSAGQFRLLEIVSSRIQHIIPDDIILECLNPAGTKSYRIEEVPKDHAKLEPNEFLLPVAHFQKESYQTFGVPFLLKVKNVSYYFGRIPCIFWLFSTLPKQKEPFSSVKERIQKKLDIPEKEYEKVLSMIR